jgi:tellurite resistance protein TerA
MVISLSKGDQGILMGGNAGKITVNLNWNITPVGYTRKGILDTVLDSLKSDKIDLDIECLYEMTDGTKGILQALGNTFGSYSGIPYIAIDKDDRSGNSKNGETLTINGGKCALFKRILVYGHLYSGAPNWQEADCEVTIKPDIGDTIKIKIDEHDTSKRICAIALFESVTNGAGEACLGVERLVQYYTDHQDMDTAFKFGLRWKAGSK